MVDSYSKRAANVVFNPVRYIRYDYGAFWLLKAWVLITMVSIACAVVSTQDIGKGHQSESMRHGVTMAAIGFSIFFALISLAILSLIVLSSISTSTAFRKGALTPAMIISANPLEYIALANMSTGMGPDIYAVQRMPLDPVPEITFSLGMRIACVSTYRSGDELESWKSFRPEVIALGTGNLSVLNDCLRRIPEQDFVLLEKCIKSQILPGQCGELMWVNTELLARQSAG